MLLLQFGYCSVLSPKKLTAWKVSKYGVFSRPYFPVFGPEKTPYLDHFYTVTNRQALSLWTLWYFSLKIPAKKSTKQSKDSVGIMKWFNLFWIACLWSKIKLSVQRFRLQEWLDWNVQWDKKYKWHLRRYHSW